MTLNTPADSNYEDWSTTDVPRIRENFPRWLVQDFEDGDAAITCPKVEGRCGLTAIVNLEEWSKRRNDKVQTRACPYCFKAARVPPELLKG